MAMVKPTALAKSAFDANTSEFFAFTSNGGNQIVKNKITIRLNSNNSVVYTNTQETFGFGQTVPSGTLTNGVYYNYFFNTYDINNNESPNSNVIPFYCYTAPTLFFTNITNNATIESSNYLFNVEYNQTQGELLDNLKFILYDINGTILAESNTFYSTDAPPVQFSYMFSGMENNTSYRIKAEGSTINGTTITTGLITFEVRFENPAVYTRVDLENKCHDGYVQFRSNLVFIDAQSNPSPPVYISTTSVDISDFGSWVEWGQGYEVPSSFLLRLWMTPALLGEFCKMWNNSNAGDYIQLNLIRNIPYGESGVKDYIEFVGKSGNNFTNIYSNKVELMNNLSEFFLWVKKVDNTYEFVIEVISRTPNELTWNPEPGDINNVEFNKITDIFWQDESFDSSPAENYIMDTNTMFPITNTKISNGIFDHIDITRDTTLTYTTDLPVWTYNTILDCDFNNNINGGNTNILLSQLQELKIKRREKGTFNWVTLKDIPIETVADINVAYQDSFVPSFKTFQWALVPVLNGSIEGEYVIGELEVFFDGVFISNSEKIFKLYNAVVYGGTTANKNIGMLQPIGSRYPIFIDNSIVNYQTGDITGTLLGYNFDQTRKINRADVVKQTQDFIEFLNDGTAKVITDWNGNIKLVRISPSPTISYNSSYGNGVTQVTFNWTEQGQYDNQEDLYYNNLIEVLS